MDLTTWESIRSKLVLPASGKCIVIGLAAIMIMVAVVAGSNIFDTATASTFEISHEDLAENSESSSSQPETVFVHVSGCVKEPGLVELAKGDRVADAIKAAGGFNEEARIDSVNLARVLQDGEQVIVAGIDERGQQDAANPQVTQTPTAENGSPLVNINAATAAELQSLPGIGPTTAQKIVSDRDANGPFSSVEDLTRVSGIGDKKLAAISDLICV